MDPPHPLAFLTRATLPEAASQSHALALN